MRQRDASSIDEKSRGSCGEAAKAFDSNAIGAELDKRGALAVNPSKADRKPQILHDAEMYKWRHLIENYFQQLKSSATSPPATPRPIRFAAALYLAAAILTLRWMSIRNEALQVERRLE